MSPGPPRRKKISNPDSPDRWGYHFHIFSISLGRVPRVFFLGGGPGYMAGRFFSQREVHVTSTSPISLRLVVRRGWLLGACMHAQLPRAFPEALLDTSIPAGTIRIPTNQKPHPTHLQSYPLQCLGPPSSQRRWAIVFVSNARICLSRLYSNAS